jgi:uncharacterized membrane protein YhaH (DUF805 family)
MELIDVLLVPSIFQSWQAGSLALFKPNFADCLYAGIVLFHLATVAARLHDRDRDRNGGLSLTAFLPFISLVLYLYLLTMPGSNDQNRFGVPDLFLSSEAGCVSTAQWAS